MSLEESRKIVAEKGIRHIAFIPVSEDLGLTVLFIARFGGNALGPPSSPEMDLLIFQIEGGILVHHRTVIGIGLMEPVAFHPDVLRDDGLLPFQIVHADPVTVRVDEDDEGFLPAVFPDAVVQGQDVGHDGANIP